MTLLYKLSIKSKVPKLLPIESEKADVVEWSEKAIISEYQLR